MFDLIFDQIWRYHGWRFYLPIIAVAAIAALIHFTIGWTDISTSCIIILTLIATLSGIFWQYLHERRR